MKLSNCRFIKNKLNCLLTISNHRLKVDLFEHSISYSNLSTLKYILQSLVVYDVVLHGEKN